MFNSSRAGTLSLINHLEFYMFVTCCPRLIGDLCPVAKVEGTQLLLLSFLLLAWPYQWSGFLSRCQPFRSSLFFLLGIRLSGALKIVAFPCVRFWALLVSAWVVGIHVATDEVCLLSMSSALSTVGAVAPQALGKEGMVGILISGKRMANSRASKSGLIYFPLWKINVFSIQ